MVRGPRHGSLSGVLCGCARLPIHISGGSMDGNQPLLLLSSLSHAFVQLHALPPLTGLCSLMLRPTCAPLSGVPWSCLFGWCRLLNTNHTGFGKPHQLFAVGGCDPSASSMSVEVCRKDVRIPSGANILRMVSDRWWVYGGVTVAVGGACSGSYECGCGCQFFITHLLQ